MTGRFAFPEQVRLWFRIVEWEVEVQMPYCTQCGNQVGPVDRFCARCGKGQATAAGAGAAPGGTGGGTYQAGRDPISRINAVDSKTASLLCYVPIVGWIMSIVVLASAKYHDDFETRFHAFQGLYLFVAWLIADWVLSPMMSSASHALLGIHLGPLLKALII